MGSHALLQGIFPTQQLNPGLLHCRWILYQLSYPGSPFSAPIREQKMEGHGEDWRGAASRGGGGGATSREIHSCCHPSPNPATASDNVPLENIAIPETYLWIKPCLRPLGFTQAGKEDSQGKVKGQEVGRLWAALPAVCPSRLPGTFAHFIPMAWVHRDGLGKE